MDPDEKEMHRIIKCWALAEKRAKHLCAFETLGLRRPGSCVKPSQAECRKAWQRLCMRLHPDRHSERDALATEATRCVNLAKDYLFAEHFGDAAAARVAWKHEQDRAEAQAREAAEEKAKKEEAEALEVATLEAQEERLKRPIDAVDEADEASGGPKRRASEEPPC